MTLSAGYQLYFTDGDLNRVGQFIDTWTRLDIVLRARSVSSISLTLPWSERVADLASPGNRIVILRDIGDGWSYLTSGPLEHDDDFDWSSEPGDNADPGQLVLPFADERSRIASMVSYPDPGDDFEDQTSTARYTRAATNPETIARDLVDLNCGAGALAYRRIPHLDLGDVAGVTGTVDYSTRFGKLGDDLRALSAASGQFFDWRVREEPGQLLFELTLPVDRSPFVRFSRPMGNLTALSYRHEAPIATAALVGGDGTGTSRLLRERTVSSPWGRREIFVNLDSSNANELIQAGDRALVDNGERATLTASAIDIPGQRFGQAYDLNDLVAVDVRADLTVLDYVTAVRIVVDRDGERVTPIIGTGEPSTGARTLAAMRDLDRRIGQVERG